MRTLLLIATCLLAACAPYQKAGTDKNGVPYVVQHGGWWSRTKGIVQKAENGPIKLQQVIEEQDGVTGPQAAFDTVTNYGIARALSNERINSNDNDAKVGITKDNNLTGVKHHELDNAAIPLKGAATVNEINAKK